MFDTARDDLSAAIKGSIPLELKNRLGKNDLLTSGLTFVGQVSEQVSTHKSLTSTMSMRRMKKSDKERPGSAGSGGAFMDVAAHYMSNDPDINLDQERIGRLDALRMNAILQQMKSLSQREKMDRRSRENAMWTGRTAIAEGLEEDTRAEILRDEEKMYSRLSGTEVGEFLVRKKREQVASRTSVIQRAAESLRQEREQLREVVLRRTAQERKETTVAQSRFDEVFQACLAELPMTPSATNIDAEVARLILRDRRSGRPEYFQDLL
jgi:hypothetical protein